MRLVLFVFAAVLCGPPAARALELGLPADCALGEDCFVQQHPDMQPGEGAVDPFCGAATYDGHDGVDLRVMSMADVERGVPVIAMADGKVLRLRDGEPDRLALTEQDQAAVAAKECGNGLIIDHGGGVETQYCHLRQGSIAVKPDMPVKRGDKIGEIGASGAAQFPHVHVTLRSKGAALDPSTGRKLSDGCGSRISDEPMFAADVAAAVGTGGATIMSMGVAGDVIDHAALSVSGPPPAATSASPNRVGWVWFINLRPGDRIRVALTGPDGVVVSEQTSEPMDRSKASYSAYAGKRGSPTPGNYRVAASLLRDGRPVMETTRDVAVE